MTYNIYDISFFLEWHYANLDDALYNPIFYHLHPMLPWENMGTIYADCGCIDYPKTFGYDPFLRSVWFHTTVYHDSQCVLAGFPMEHIEIKLMPDQLRYSSIKVLTKQNLQMVKDGYIGLLDRNWYATDTIGRFAECVHAKVESLNTAPKTKNWA